MFCNMICFVVWYVLLNDVFWFDMFHFDMFCMCSEKRTNEMVRSWTLNEQSEKMANASISIIKCIRRIYSYLCKYLILVFLLPVARFNNVEYNSYGTLGVYISVDFINSIKYGKMFWQKHMSEELYYID